MAAKRTSAALGALTIALSAVSLAPVPAHAASAHAASAHAASAHAASAHAASAHAASAHVAPAHAALAHAASAHAAPAHGAFAQAAPAVVARYSFDAGTVAGSRITDRSGRGHTLTVRTADGGRIAFRGTSADRHAAFPAPCPPRARTCPRVFLEARDHPDLDPGTRPFTWGAALNVTKSRVTDSSNVMQKGFATYGSQWKLQLGATNGRAHCVMVGRGDETINLVRSTTSVADGTWHRVACRRAATALTILVDGRAEKTIRIPAGLSVANTSPVRIGGPTFSPGADMYNGLLDDAYARLG
jgi:hypothetical protein